MAREGTLEYAVSALIDSHPHTQFEPVYRHVKRPSVQLDLFAFHGSAMSQSTMGLFFELTGRGFYGGAIYGARRELPANYPRFKSNPDTVDLREKQVREHKGCSTRRTLILRDGQIEGYASDQAEHPDWDFRASLFRHSFPNVRAFEGTESELFGKVSKKTVYEIDIPLPVLIALHDGYQRNNGVILGSRCDNGTYPSSTRVSSSSMNRLFLNPFDALNRLGLNPDDYTVNRFVSPQNFSVAGKKVKPFPILRINHGNIAEWRNNFVAKELDKRVKPSKPSEVKDLTVTLPF